MTNVFRSGPLLPASRTAVRTALKRMVYNCTTRLAAGPGEATGSGGASIEAVLNHAAVTNWLYRPMVRKASAQLQHSLARIVGA